MGCPYYSLKPEHLLSTSDCISIVGILVNSIIAVWIVHTIQKRLANRRVLKDHFIEEIKQIRNDYREYLNGLYSNSIKASRVIPWFKLMNIRIEDIMSCINRKHRNISLNILHPYQHALRELITNDEAFIKDFNSDKPIGFTESSKNKIIMFQQEYSHLFNDVIILINDAQ